MLQIPGATSYMGCIGKDKFGEEMKKNSRQAGVNVITLLLLFPVFRSSLVFKFNKSAYQVHYYEDETAPTGTCAVCVVGGERSVYLFSLYF